MSRRRQLESPTVSLFPFLAVLICTMGTLIVLLVVVVQQARNTSPIDEVPAPVATATPVPMDLPPIDPFPPAAGADPQMVQRLEDTRWGNQQLSESHAKTLVGLEERRGVLSRIEDQVRTLSEQLALLESKAQALLDAESQQTAPEQQSQADLGRLRLEIQAAKQRLAEKQAEATDQQQRYAIIPYEGANGTRRRPIYVECVADAVVMQPEGIRFGASDFTVKDASNPLATALRAYREYLNNAGMISETGEPYPLIVVRPNGERAYSACRAAMISWDDAFGYELVPAEMKLAYPPVDGGLKAFLEEAVAVARNRMRPSLAVGGLPQSIVGRPGGAGGPGRARTDGAPTSRGGGPGGGAFPGTTSREAYAATEQEAPTYSIGKGIGGGLVPNNSAAAEGPVMDLPAPQQNNSPPATHAGRGQLVRGAGRASGRAFSDHATSRLNGAPGEQAMPNANANATAQNQTTRGSNAPLNNTANANGSAGGQSGTPGGSAQGVNNAVASGPTGGAMGTAASAATSTNADDASQPAAMTASFTPSIAEAQGANWALPNAADGSIAIARPITATVEPGRIVVRTDKGNFAIPMANNAVGESVQPLVSKVWEVIESWGIAGPGVYWKPTIHVRVTPGTQATFNELRALLQDSGLNIQQRK